MTTLRLTLMCALVGLLAGCLSSDPVYRTSHTLIEPTGANARVLVGQCKQMQQQCNQFATTQRTECAADAQRMANVCVATCATQRTRADVIRGVHGTRGLNEDNCRMFQCAATNNQCRSIGSNCSKDYQSCVVNAGGRIQSKTRCVRNCDGT